MEKHTAYISIGSNMGNKAENCQKGIEALTISGSSRVVKRSRFYKTEPVDYTDQEWFVNGVVKIETGFDPFHLMKELKSIEQMVGRTPNTVKFGPRVLDLDIVLYGDLIVKSPDLSIPHPRMHKRCFVLRPLCDIDPDIVHPVLKKSIQNLLNNINDDNQRVLPY